MKPVELNTAEQESETQEPVYRGLQSAERALAAAQAEQRRYSDAVSSILAGHNFRVREAARLREQMKQKITQAALDGKLDDFDQELQEGCQRIVTMKEEIDRLATAQRGLEREQSIPEREVSSCLGEVAKLKGYAAAYEKGKAEYAELYRVAVSHEANRQKFSTEGPPGVGRMNSLRQQLESQAGFLGCYADLQNFRKDLEAQA